MEKARFPSGHRVRSRFSILALMILEPQAGSEFCLISATSDMAISIVHIHSLIYSFSPSSLSFLEFHIFLALDICGV